MSNYYFALGVSKEADSAKIKKAYRTFCKQYHPDVTRSPADKQKFLKVQEAYETLSDPEKRKRYDKTLGRKNTDIGISTNWQSVKQRTAFSHSLERFHSFIDDFFEGFLSGFYEEGLAKEKELYLELILSPEEARQGGVFPINIPVAESCEECSGSGVWFHSVCPACSGYGKIKSSRVFNLHVPAGVSHGSQARVSLEGIGLNNVFLIIDISIAQ
ncbi:MAG: DnaJ domain-containing protein [Spirochaetales bacterium]|nr:DnaJ domain-containing protein [Spirochaetales bacterium]